MRLIVLTADSEQRLRIDGLRVANFPLSDDGHNSYVDLNSIPQVGVDRHDERHERDTARCHHQELRPRRGLELAQPERDRRDADGEDDHTASRSREQRCRRTERRGGCTMGRFPSPNRPRC